MKAVETELGTRVFERHSRQVVLTKAGRVFRREAIQTLEHNRRAVSLVQAMVRVAILAAAGDTLRDIFAHSPNKSGAIYGETLITYCRPKRRAGFTLDI